MDSQKPTIDRSVVGGVGRCSCQRFQCPFVVVCSLDDFVERESSVPDLAQEVTVCSRHRQRQSAGLDVLDSLDTESKHVHRVFGVVSVNVYKLRSIGVSTTANTEQAFSLSAGVAEEALPR